VTGVPNAASLSSQIRIARPTDQLDAVRRFYCDGLGLEELGSFEGHAGYDGVFIGLPRRDVHLEFTSHRDGSPGAAPSTDNLLVLYVGSATERDALAAQLAALCVAPVPPENPYWVDVEALTFEDPDGWRVVLVPDDGA
jgi:catechol 2,3-dioxygenase-like lactoylglutathione lyase family enzyme